MPTRGEYAVIKNMWDASVFPLFSHANSLLDGEELSIVNVPDHIYIDLSTMRIGQTMKVKMSREALLGNAIPTIPLMAANLPIGGTFSFYRDEEQIHFLPGTFPVPIPDNHQGFMPLDEEPEEDPNDPYGLIGWRDEYIALDDEEPSLDNPSEDYLGLTENIAELTPTTVNVVYDPITRGFFGCDSLIKLGTSLALCDALNHDIIVSLPDAPDGARIAIKKEDLSYNSVYVLDNTGAPVIELYFSQHAVELAAVNGEWIVILSLCPDAIKPNVLDLGNLKYFVCHDEDEQEYTI